MFRVEIKEVKKFNKDNLFRRKHIFHFNNMFEVNDFLNSLQDDYSFINDGKNKFSYFGLQRKLYDEGFHFFL